MNNLASINEHFPSVTIWELAILQHLKWNATTREELLILCSTSSINVEHLE